MEEFLLANDVEFNTDIQETSIWVTQLSTFAPILLMIVFFIFLMNQMQGGGNKVMSFGKSRAKRMAVDQPKITFKDVAGVDEAVEELDEIKEFLENPKRFQSLGARIPKGVLLFGPPARQDPFGPRGCRRGVGCPFSVSPGLNCRDVCRVGASRVRDLFDQAKQNQPCIIFIDEIDAVGRHRGAGLGGGHDEREQTLTNCWRRWMVLRPTKSIIIMAATNRPTFWIRRLLSPAAIDRQIVVDRPDREGRKAILACAC
jgi:cell division protease FtsH